MSRLSFIYLLLCFTRRSGWQSYCPFGLLGIIYYFNPWSLTTGRETSSLLQYHTYHPTHHSIRDLPNREGVHDFAKPGGGEVTTSQTMWSHSSPRSSFFSRLNYIWGQFSFLKMHALNSHLRSLTWGDSCLMSSPVVWAMERNPFSSQRLLQESTINFTCTQLTRAEEGIYGAAGVSAASLKGAVFAINQSHFQCKWCCLHH